MTPTEEIFPDGDYIIYQDVPNPTPIPCVPAGFELSQLKPSHTTDFNWDFIVNAIQDPQDIIGNAYLFLSLYEDLIAIYEDRRHTIATSYFAIIWEQHENPVWRSIVAKAIMTDIQMEPPYYNRPSLCLLSKSWLDFYDFDFETPEFHESLTFRSIEHFPPLIQNHNQWTLQE